MMVVFVLLVGQNSLKILNEAPIIILQENLNNPNNIKLEFERQITFIMGTGNIFLPKPPT